MEDDPLPCSLTANGRDEPFPRDAGKGGFEPNAVDQAVWRSAHSRPDHP
jgi:hypothetical protein